MTREEAKRRAELYSALANGKTIQIQSGINGEWIDVQNSTLRCIDDDRYKYRVKSEPKYRPFTSQDECWNEMLKHEPMGWVKGINVMVDRHICLLRTTEGIPTATFSDSACVEHEISSLFGKYTFADGAPFGIKED